MPWELIGVDGEFTVRHREALQKMQAALQAAWLQNAQPLDLAAAQEKRSLSLNEQHLAHTIQVGLTRAALAEPQHLQPVICPVGDNLLFGVELIATSGSQLLGAAQVLVPRAPWEEWKKVEKGPDAPLGAWGEAIQNLLKSAGQNRENPRAATFKLKLGLMRGSPDNRRGAHLCLNLLASQALASNFVVLPPIGERLTYHLRRVWDIQEPVLRATRELVLDWGTTAPDGGPFKAQGRWSEAVLGSPIDTSFKAAATVDIRQGKAVLTPEWMEAMRQEAASLKTDEWPQVVKIRGAWAYLDRGRAWGLDMNDRLYLDDGQRLIKGHVVGFYGSALGLKSPRGFPVHEGAILFIRTGQRKVQVGDAFRFDPTRFPTPWPPVRQPSQAQAQ